MRKLSRGWNDSNATKSDRGLVKARAQVVRNSLPAFTVLDQMGQCPHSSVQMPSLRQPPPGLKTKIYGERVFRIDGHAA
jgi:hypothetical protein